MWSTLWLYWTLRDATARYQLRSTQDRSERHAASCKSFESTWTQLFRISAYRGKRNGDIVSWRNQKISRCLPAGFQPLRLLTREFFVNVTGIRAQFHGLNLDARMSNSSAGDIHIEIWSNSYAILLERGDWSFINLKKIVLFTVCAVASACVNGDWPWQWHNGNFRPLTESTSLNRSKKNLLHVITSAAPTAVSNLVQIRTWKASGKMGEI